MKLRSVIAILATALLCISASAKEKQTTPQPIFNRAPLAEVPYAQLPLGEITPDGWLRAQMQTMLDGMTGNLDDVYPQQPLLQRVSRLLPILSYASVMK